MQANKAHLHLRRRRSVLRLHLVLHPLVMVVHRHRQHLLGLRLRQGNVGACSG